MTFRTLIANCAIMWDWRSRNHARLPHLLAFNAHLRPCFAHFSPYTVSAAKSAVPPGPNISRGTDATADPTSRHSSRWIELTS